MSEKDEFVKGYGTIAKLSQASGSLYDASLDARVTAQDVFAKIANEYGLPAPDFQDEGATVQFRQQVSQLETGRQIPRLASNLEEILDDPGKLASNALSIRPATDYEGPEGRKSAHEKFIKYQTILETADGGNNYGAVIRDVTKIVKDEIEKRLSAEDPKNEYLDEKTRKNFINYVLSLTNDPKVGLYIVSQLRNKAKEKFDKTFEDGDDEKATYTFGNIRALLEGSAKDKVEAAERAYRIAA